MEMDLLRDKGASHKAKADAVRAMTAGEMTADMTRYQFHRIVKDAVDEVAPRHLNKKGRWEWAARALGIGFDRTRKAYQHRVRRVEHHEFIGLADRYAALLAKQERSLVERLEASRAVLTRWEASCHAHASTRAALVGQLPCMGGGADRRADGGLGQSETG